MPGKRSHSKRWFAEDKTFRKELDGKGLRISVITPSYNHGDFIEETILSVLCQDHRNFELIIVDGESKDHTPEIISKYREYISHYICEKDTGQSEAFNKGLKLATGDVIAWLNSDDYYEQGVFSMLHEEFSRNPEKNCIIGRSHVYGNEISYIAPWPIFESREKTIGYGMIVQPATFIRRAVYSDIGPLREDLHYCMDLEWWMRYLVRFGIEGVLMKDIRVVNFRLHESSKTVSLIDNFVSERDSLFHSLALQCGEKKIADVIHSLTGAEMQFTMNADTDNNELKRIVNYYLLKRGDEYYRNLQKDKVADCFNAIDPSCLSFRDAAYLRKLKFRNKYIPSGVIRTLRRK